MKNSESVPRDTAFDLLSNSRRRFVLEYLSERDEPAELGEIAEAMAAKENDTTPDQIDASERKRAYVSLYQTHVPRLSDSGVVDYDSEVGLVSLSSDADDVLEYITDENERPWAKIHLLVAAVGLFLYSIAVFGTVLEETLVGFVVLAAILLVGLFQFVSD